MNLRVSRIERKMSKWHFVSSRNFRNGKESVQPATVFGEFFPRVGKGDRSRGRRRLNDDPREENEGEVEGGVAIFGISRGLLTN